MLQSLLYTFLELGDAVSRNLEFAHANDDKVSYGEETITETNLLEILRKHRERGTKLTAVSKGEEAKNGADWEWVIVGKKYSFFMRVQAKRTTKKDRLSVQHKIKGSGSQQIDVLIKNAKATGSGTIEWCPVYCFYSKNSERRLWVAPPSNTNRRYFEFGCLIAHASLVKAKPKISTIRDVEDISVPWHYFFGGVGGVVSELVEERISASKNESFLRSAFQFAVPLVDRFIADAGPSWFPTVDQLNGYADVDLNLKGLRETNPLEIEQERLRKRSGRIDAPRFMVLDASQEPRRRE